MILLRPICWLRGHVEDYEGPLMQQCWRCGRRRATSTSEALVYRMVMPPDTGDTIHFPHYVRFQSGGEMHFTKGGERFQGTPPPPQVETMDEAEAAIEIERRRRAIPPSDMLG